MHRVTETTTSSGYVVEDHPAIHIMHGKFSDKTFSDALEYLEGLKESDLFEISENNLLFKKYNGELQYRVDYWHPLMQGYCKELEKAVSEYVQHCTDPLNLPKFRGVLDRTILIDSCWALKMNIHDYLPMHTHQTLAKTGIGTVSYLKLPEKLLDPNNPDRPENCKYHQYAVVPGGLTFSWSGINSFNMEDDVAPTNARHIYPELGEFWIFPKHLHHLGTPYQHEGERWSISSDWSVLLPDENQQYGLGGHSLLQAREQGFSEHFNSQGRTEK